MKIGLYKSFLLLVFCVFFIPEFGWAQFQLKGSIVDQQSGEAITFAKIEIPQLNSKIVTDLLGNFEVLLYPDNYEIQVTALGYKVKTLQISLFSDTSIVVKMDALFQEIDEVLIADQQLRAELNKTSLNIEQLQLSNSENSQANSFAELLEKKPGMQAFTTGVGVSKPVIRGLMANRVAVINQGVRQEGQQWGMDHGLEIDPFSVERIQIIKGAASLQYGSSASGGVVKILEDFAPQKGWGFQYNSRFKTNNQSFGNSVKLSYRKKNHFFIGRLSREEYQDYRVPAATFSYNGFSLPIVDGILKNTAGNSRSLGFIYGYSATKIRLRFHYSNYLQNVGLFPGATGIPRAFDLEEIGNQKDIDIPNQQVNHQTYKLTLNYKIGKAWLENNIGLQINNRKENSNPLAHGFLQLEADNILALGLDLSTISQNSKYHWQGEKWKTTLGLDQQFQRNERSGWEFLLPNFRSYEAGVFGIVEKEVSNKFNWNAGLRLQYARLDSEEHLQAYFADIDSLVNRAEALSRNFSNYSFSLGFTYQPSPEWNHKLNIANSFRIPVAAELLSNGVHHGTFRHEMGNASLEIENGIQIDWGSQWAIDYLSFKISPFFNYFSNFIYLKPSGSFSPLPDAGQIYIYSSTEAIHTGGELLIESNFDQRLFFNLGMEYVHNINLNTSLPLPFSPPYSQMAGIDYVLKTSSKVKWKFGLNHRFTAAQNRVDRNENATPAYQLFNFNSKAEVQWKNIKINFGFAVQNIFDTSYLSHLSRYRILNLPEQGRNLIFQANISF